MVYPEKYHQVPTGTYRCFQLRLVKNNATKDDFHFFSILEKMEPDMQSYILPKPVANRSAYGEEKDDYKVYWLQCDFQVTNSFLNDPTSCFSLNDGRSNFNLQFFNTTFSEEPTKGDYFVLPLCYERYDLFSEILPTGNGPMYVKTYVDKNRETTKLLEQYVYLKRQINEASQAMFGINLTEWPEHIGNIYMLWHHEEIRDLRMKSCNKPNGIFIHIDTRQGHHGGGEVVVWDAHDVGSVVVNGRYKVEPDERELFVKLNDFPLLFRIDYYDANQNLVAFTKSHTFLTSINTTVSLAEKEVVMVAKDENGAETRSVPVTKYSTAEKIQIGEPIENLHYYFAKHKKKHAIDWLEKEREFIFFNGDKQDTVQKENLKKAKEVIREILNRGDKVVYVCDPYFNCMDFQEYVHYIHSVEVKIRILNSKADVGMAGLKRLIPLIRGYNQKMCVPDYITCRVLKGEKSMLHDRFIVADDQVWYMGSSFGEFGARACTLCKMSDAAASIVKSYIEKWWEGEETRDLFEYESEQVDVKASCALCVWLKNIVKRICN